MVQHGEGGMPTPRRDRTVESDGVGAAEALVRLGRAVQDVRSRAAERHHLTSVQAELVCTVLLGPRGMAELARLLGVEKAAMTGLVDRAERRGLVHRCPVPGDRRARRVALTDAGRRVAVAFAADASQELGGLLTALAPGERRLFRDALAKVVADPDCRKPENSHDA
jgi:DNA-binding MarR family transcriptional regulator